MAGMISWRDHLEFNGVNMSELTPLSDRITKEYRTKYRTLLKTTKKQIETPSTETADEVHRLTGYLEGLKRALSFIAEAQNDHTFNF